MGSFRNFSYPSSALYSVTANGLLALLAGLLALQRKNFFLSCCAVYIAMEILQGANDSLRRYVIEEHVYKRDKVANGCSYLECVERNCPGKCHFRPEALPVHTSPHNHEPDPVVVSKLRLKSHLIQRAGSELLTKYRLIYLDGIARLVN